MHSTSIRVDSARKAAHTCAADRVTLVFTYFTCVLAVFRRHCQMFEVIFVNHFGVAQVAIYCVFLQFFLRLHDRNRGTTL